MAELVVEAQPDPEMEPAGLVPVDQEQVLEQQVGPLQSQVFPSSQTKVKLNQLFSYKLIVTVSISRAFSIKKYIPFTCKALCV